MAWVPPHGSGASPRWLVSVGREQEAMSNLAYYRRLTMDNNAIRHEFAEIKAAIRKEQELRRGLGLRAVFLGKGNWPRFCIAVVIFMLQQWSGQNSVNYYGPQIFASVRTQHNALRSCKSDTENHRSDTQARRALYSQPVYMASSR